MCGGQNSLSKGGLNAKAGFCYPYNNRYISSLLSDDNEIFISKDVKANVILENPRFQNLVYLILMMSLTKY